MSDPTSIFGNNQNNGGDPANQPGNSNPGNVPSDTQVADLLKSIVNERGEPKYKTLQDALVGLKNAQEYIPQLKTNLTERENELNQLREQVNKVNELQETVRRLTEQNNGNGSPAASVSEQDIAALVSRAVDQTLTTRETLKKQTENTAQVVSALRQAFGEKAEEVYNNKAVELGVTLDEFNRLAANNPKLVLTTLGVTDRANVPTGSPSAPMGSTVNTSGIQPRNESLVGRNTKSTLVGATSQDVLTEGQNARKMVDELHSKGLSVYDLTDPKVFRKHFG